MRSRWVCWQLLPLAPPPAAVPDNIIRSLRRNPPLRPIQDIPVNYPFIGTILYFIFRNVDYSLRNHGFDWTVFVETLPIPPDIPVSYVWAQWHLMILYVKPATSTSKEILRCTFILHFIYFLMYEPSDCVWNGLKKKRDITCILINCRLISRHCKANWKSSLKIVEICKVSVVFSMFTQINAVHQSLSFLFEFFHTAATCWF